MGRLTSRSPCLEAAQRLPNAPARCGQTALRLAHQGVDLLGTGGARIGGVGGGSRGLRLFPLEDEVDDNERDQREQQEAEDEIDDGHDSYPFPCVDRVRNCDTTELRPNR